MGVWAQTPRDARPHCLPPETPWPALRSVHRGSCPEPSVICPPPPSAAKDAESQSPTARCSQVWKCGCQANRLPKAGQTTPTRKRPFPETAGVTHQSSVLASGSQAGHRFSFPITGSATWPNSGSFAKGPVYSLRCQMVAAFSSADTIVEFLQLPISSYRNIFVEGNKADWFAMFSIPDTPLNLLPWFSRSQG